MASDAPKLARVAYLREQRPRRGAFTRFRSTFGATMHMFFKGTTNSCHDQQKAPRVRLLFVCSRSFVRSISTVRWRCGNFCNSSCLLYLTTLMRFLKSGCQAMDGLTVRLLEEAALYERPPSRRRRVEDPFRRAQQ